MGLKIFNKNNVQVFQIEGDLDSSVVESLRHKLEVALENGCSIHAFDASAMSMIDSSGIGLLVSLFKQATAKGMAFVLAGLNGQPEEMIRFLKIDKRIPVHATLERCTGCADKPNCAPFPSQQNPLCL